MTPNEIQNRRFDKAMSGYRPDEVNAYMAEVARYAEGILKEKAELEQKMMVLAEKLEEYREDEDSLRAALIGAQKLGDSVVRESKRKAELILTEAQQKADLMVSKAQQKADLMVSQIKVNIQKENDNLSRIQAEVARFKSQMLSLYRQHIESVNMIPVDEKDFPQQLEMKQEPPAPVSAPVDPPKPEVKPYQKKPEPEKAVEPADMEVPPAAPPEKPRKEFILRFDDDNPDVPFEEVEIERIEDYPKRESRHGDLLFGDRYTLTRKD